MKHGITTLTNYINKQNGRLYHGSELSYYERFKSGNYQKVKSYQCNQRMPFSIDKGNHWEVVRMHYGRQQLVAIVEKKQIK